MTKKRATAAENPRSRAKVCSPGEAAELVKSGNRVALSANASAPVAFLNALYERADKLEGVELIHMRLLGKSPDTRPEMARHIRLNTTLVPSRCATPWRRETPISPPHIFTRSAVYFSKDRESST